MALKLSAPSNDNVLAGMIECSSFSGLLQLSGQDVIWHGK